jgi:hypothetical protein
MHSDRGFTWGDVVPHPSSSRAQSWDTWTANTWAGSSLSGNTWSGNTWSTAAWQ